MAHNGVNLHITGIVQGVGFRPFVYGLASRFKLTGWVQNTSAGVDIEVEGAQTALDQFITALQTETPALARLDSFTVSWQEPQGYYDFRIIHSTPLEYAFQPISPDVGMCADCLRELFDPSDRRYRYPFINCTNCGPRFTIIQDIPYDRPNTTMATFKMCPDCAAEYGNPLDRRFHAQPVACPVCGPQIWLEETGRQTIIGRGEDALQAVRARLLAGQIIAIKGLGGFHLACDATNNRAVTELRRRKLRVDKPFALMFASVEQVSAHCQVSAAEQMLLISRQRPIVILERSLESGIATETAPHQDTLGVMLPYTPLHYLLFTPPERLPSEYDLPPLVMTSGNLSEEPICTTNADARRRLCALADAFLFHDRDIHTRCDDSVVHPHPTNAGLEDTGRSYMYTLRRARGYAPDPLRLPWETPPLLATGAELKNTFCLTRDQYAFLSHHIGDLENFETLEAFETAISHYERLFRIRPEGLVYDLHPDYLATRYALARASNESLPARGVQHHHAHIAACMLDNALTGDEPLIGIALDGTGYGDDGAIWGGEFLLADYGSYRRLLHLKYTPLPGGDLAVRQPWRMALAWLWNCGLEWSSDLPPVQHATQINQFDQTSLDILAHQLRQGVNTPQTSSMGRLFDAAAALLGVRQEANYEAQAAIELEAISSSDEPGFYSIEIRTGIIDPQPLLEAMIHDMRSGIAVSRIAARFHNSIARLVLDACKTLREQTGQKEVAFSGGVWQNIYLLKLSLNLLQEAGFRVYLHHQVPTNDGGLALGQAAIGFKTGLVVKEN